MGTVTLRFAEKRDAGMMMAIYAPFVLETTATWETAVPPRPEFEARMEQCSADGLPWIVVEEDGALLGYAYGARFGRRAGYAWDVEVSVYLSEDAHGRHIGTALYGALLALLGAVTIALSGLSGQEAQATGQEALRSNLLALAGAVLMAAHWLAGRQIRQTLAAEVYTPVLYLITAALLALCLPLSGGFRMPLSALPYMAGLVIGSTLLGHAVFAYALSGVSANVISFALLGEPVGAMIFSMIFFGEVPTWPVALGGLLTLMGLALYLAFAGGEKQPA